MRPKTNITTRCEAKALPTGSQLFLYGDIGGGFLDGITADAVKKQLETCKGDLSVYINSAGGSVFEGLAIHNQLKRYGGGKVTCYVDGLAASIASIIAMAGHRCEMAPASMMMIHNAQSIVMGSAADMRKCADDLDAVTSTIRGVYTAKTKMSEQDVAALMDAETWLTADECIKKGFADAMVSGCDCGCTCGCADGSCDCSGNCGCTCTAATCDCNCPCCQPASARARARVIDTYKNTPAELREKAQPTAVAETIAEMQARALKEHALLGAKLRRSQRTA